ncbi:DUF1345 domain-containing protein [Herbiconiux sp. VKM Ac-1786]|uniref:DUF1345 domain-containing protein n=1 Tax=Herbiconiux sp. VKM Ac-1786 TaxID=2783824 RepID=UPI001889EF3D|nr:DUF1345 domain-containing protein [Herbiconiux sp. VKM Ac-1786]MBF4571939.1 DUF1345 domain-containing protein [Herbiconiux sp. VKM Ac-1786]
MKSETDHRTARHRPEQGFDGIWHHAGFRVAVMFVVFVLLGWTVGMSGSWLLAPALGWIGAAMTFVIWVRVSVLRLGSADTAMHATREDPTQPVAQTLIILASLASFGSLALLLTESRAAGGIAQFGLAAAAVATVATSWILVQVLFTLRYAALYYRSGGKGVDFNQEDRPRYLDFAYLAFTIGMTYQVSDTPLTSSVLRREVLRHALLSFLFGVGVLASAVNLVASLAR